MWHRGPDAQRTLRRGDSHFAFDRLSILDLSDAAMQPMLSQDGSIVLVFNGEIYNYKELRRDCEARGAVFRTTSDTEVVLEAYRLYGARCIKRLDGMFALGIWDESRRQLLLARDRPGKKPLYYTRDSRLGFRFASTAQAIIDSGIPGDMDAGAVPSLLTYGYPRAPRTMYQEIAQLPPAHTLLLTEGKAPVIERYWENPFVRSAIPFTVEEACVELRRAVDQAVRRRLQADVPVGALLSGGMDSSVVVATMAQVSAQPIKTFCAGFANYPNFDERSHARVVAKHFGTHHEEFMLEPSSFDVVDELVRMHDAPFGDSSALPTAFVSKLARTHVAVSLTGDGGDELFAGYVRFLIAEATDSVSPVLLGAAHRLWDHLPTDDREVLLRAKRFLKRATFELPDRLLSWQTYFGLELDEVIRADLRGQLPMDEPIEQSREVLRGMKDQSTLAKILKYNYDTYLPDDLLVKADRCSMMHSLELRSPLLDTELTNLVARMPDHLKRRGLTNKWILREAYRDRLPPSVVSRKKMGFGVPLDGWFRTDLRSHLRERLAPGSPIFEFISQAFVERLVKQHGDRTMDHSHRLWLLLTFAVWLEHQKSRTSGGRQGLRDRTPSVRAA
jgi:asparagine synthase (glutamine-hydrolysing)